MNLLPNEIMDMILSYTRPSFWVLQYTDSKTNKEESIYLAGQSEEDICNYLWNNRHLTWLQKCRRSVEPMYEKSFNFDVRENFDQIFMSMLRSLEVSFIPK